MIINTVLLVLDFNLATILTQIQLIGYLLVNIRFLALKRPIRGFFYFVKLNFIPYY
jgi:hypothetical protein